MPTHHDRPCASGDSLTETSLQQPSDSVDRGVMAMHRQGQSNEMIAMAFGLATFQVRNIVADQSRVAAAVTEDDPAPIVRRIPRKSRHPDRCPNCGAMLTMKPCLACYFREFAG